MVLFLDKKVIKGNHYVEIFFNGCDTLIPCTEDFYNTCKFESGQKINDNLFDTTYYKKGYDIIANVKLR